MFKFSIIITSLLFISSCSSYLNHGEISNYPVKDSECLELQKTLGANKKESNISMVDFSSSYTLIDTFYSPSRNSCVNSMYGITSGMPQYTGKGKDMVKIPYCNDYYFYSFNSSGATELVKRTSKKYKEVKKDGKVKLECDDRNTRKEYEEILNELRKD